MPSPVFQGSKKQARLHARVTRDAVRANGIRHLAAMIRDPRHLESLLADTRPAMRAEILRLVTPHLLFELPETFPRG